MIARARGRSACLIVGAGLALFAGDAGAYPTSVVFAPNAEVLPLGGVTGGFYVGFQYTPSPIAMSSSWGGIQGGISPSFTYAKTQLGELGFGGVELGVDGYGPDFDGSPTVVLNLKVQPFRETDYLPGLAIGVFQLSPDLSRGALLGFLALSKSFAVRTTSLGQLTFGAGLSFADRGAVSPGCLAPGGTCLFRGSAPFEDESGFLFAGYRSPWIGPVGLSVDYVGGTSAVSSINVALNLRLLSGIGPDIGEAFMGAGLWFSSDRRDGVSPGGVPDGFFLQMAVVSSVQHMLGLDRKKDPDPPARPETPKDPPKDPPPDAVSAPQPAPCPPCPACPACPKPPDPEKPADPAPKPTVKPGPKPPPKKPPPDFDP